MQARLDGVWSGELPDSEQEAGVVCLTALSLATLLPATQTSVKT